MANGMRPRELYAILDEERDDPLNFHRGAVYHKGSFSGAARNLAQFVWAIGKRAVTTSGSSGRTCSRAAAATCRPASSRWRRSRRTCARPSLAKGLSNSFRDAAAAAHRRRSRSTTPSASVFGAGDLMDVPISQAIAASSAIPGFFEPYRIGGRDYVDGDVGYTGHADLAVDAGATVRGRAQPGGAAVPERQPEEPEIRRGGLYAIMEQAGHIASLNLFNLGLREIKLLHPEVEVLGGPARAQALAAGGPLDGLRGQPGRPPLRLRTVKEWLAGPGAAVAGPRSAMQRGVDDRARQAECEDLFDRVAGLGEVALDRPSICSRPGGLERQLDLAVSPRRRAGEGAVVLDVEDVGARLRHQRGEARERARPVAQQHPGAAPGGRP